MRQNYLNNKTPQKDDGESNLEIPEAIGKNNPFYSRLSVPVVPSVGTGTYRIRLRIRIKNVDSDPNESFADPPH